MDDLLIKDMREGMKIFATLRIEKIGEIIYSKKGGKSRQEMLLTDKSGEYIAMTLWDVADMGLFMKGDTVQLISCQLYKNNKNEFSTPELVTGRMGIIKLANRPKLPEPEPKKEEVSPKIAPF